LIAKNHSEKWHTDLLAIIETKIESWATKTIIETKIESWATKTIIETKIESWATKTIIDIQKKNFNHEFLLATDETRIFTDKGKDAGYKIQNTG
jgi:hypothetical protein